ncbi:MAG: hypothetical protein ACK5JM_15470 [Rhodoblastus sp.]
MREQTFDHPQVVEQIERDSGVQPRIAILRNVAAGIACLRRTQISVTSFE